MSKDIRKMVLKYKPLTDRVDILTDVLMQEINSGGSVSVETIYACEQACDIAEKFLESHPEVATALPIEVKFIKETRRLLAASESWIERN